MAKLKTAEQIEQERLDFVLRISGNYPLPTDRPALLYVRQSSIKQVRNNIYSALQQTEDMIERALALEWSREQCTIFVENNMTKDGRIRGVSGSIPIEDRPGLKTIIEHIKKGAGAILCVDVSRLTRHADLVDAATLAQTCKRYNAVIVTSDHVYDFRKDKELELFMEEAKEAANYNKRQVGSKEYPNGKMYAARNKKADKGKVANGRAPVGLMLDESHDHLIPSPHAERVDWLYGRFRALDANLAVLYREVFAMAARGEPIFPDSDVIDEGSMHLKRVPGGWTIASRSALKHILSNPMYAGHLVYNERVVNRNAHDAIVDADNWQYAFNILSDVDLDGTPIEHGEKSVRYTQKGSTNAALMAGTRDNGRLVIDGVHGSHVYVNIALDVYALRKVDGKSVTGYVASIATNELDNIVVERVLYWCQQTERECEYKECEQAPHLAMDTVEQMTQPVSTVEDDVLEQARQESAGVERALRTSQHVMDDETLTWHFARKASLLKRIDKLEQAEKDADRQARKLEQAKDDIDYACDKWGKWTVDERRQFIRLVTETITLEEIAPGWLRLVITWSPLMGFVSPVTSTTRAVDTLYLWRKAGREWSADEIARLREYYPTATRNELLHLFPSRSWFGITQKASKSSIRRTVASDPISIPIDMSLSDLHIVKEFAIEPGKRVQWQHEYSHYQLSNGDSQS